MPSLLTNKQVQVLNLKAKGYQNKEIAVKLGLSVTAIQERLKLASHNLSAKNPDHAVVLFEKLQSEQNIQHIRQRLLSRIEKSGMGETFRAYIYEETGAESIDELAPDDGLLEVANFIDTILKDMDDD